MKLHPTYEFISDMMVRVPVENGEDYCVYDPDMLAQLFAYTPEPDEKETEYEIPAYKGDHKLKVYLFERESTPKNAPLAIMIHGGGFNTGDHKFDYNRIAYLTKHAGVKVLSVDYRLAQEGGRFPGELYDCYAALLWAYDNAELLGIDNTKLAVGGYSSGANLAAGVSLYARDHNGPKISCQLLMNPAIKAKGDTPSVMQFYRCNPMLSGCEISNMLRRYYEDVPDHEPSYYAFPGYCEYLYDVPPTLIAVGEYDPLRDECIEFAQKLFANSVPCELYVCPRAPHSFDACKDGCMTSWIWDAFVRALRREFGTL